MFVARKIAANLGLRALLVLGPVLYLRYLFTFCRKLPSILSAGDLKPLDRVMGARPVTVRMNGSKFIVDCPYADQHVTDGTFLFGSVREMYIRNCYLRYGAAQAAKTARTVVDLGANRGAFSLMMAAYANLIIAVDVNPLYRGVIARNMKVNGFTNYVIETAFIGEGGVGEDGKRCRTSLSELIRKYSLESIDLMKMDIEGSEFGLFRSPEWLTQVSALCMEVHHKYGDVQEILDALGNHGFNFVVTDVLFRPVEDPKKANFMYAWRSTNTTRAISEV